MHEEAITKNTKSVLEKIAYAGISKKFYLAGGTALALHLGHRFSIDLDWFSERFIYNVTFRRKLEKLGKLEIDTESNDTFNGALNGVKISFFEYPYPLIKPKTKYIENVYLASLPDIAAMKMEAIGSRGSYKDFIDIYFLLEHYSLKEIFEFIRKKFTKISYNEAHLLKSLVYFKDVKGTPKPKLIKQVKWQTVVGTIEQKVGEYLKNP